MMGFSSKCFHLTSAVQKTVGNCTRISPLHTWFRRVSPSIVPPLASGARHLHLHEYQSKTVLREYGLNVQRGDAASSVEEIQKIANELAQGGAKDIIVKCQVLAGGRGKGTLSSGLKGGVHVCQSPAEASKLGKDMLGYRLVTKQTTAEGELVKKVLVLEGVNIVKELYLAIVLDRAHRGPVIIASSMGGVDIEEVAAKHPDKICTVPVDIFKGITKENVDQVTRILEAEDNKHVVDTQLRNLYNLFVRSDATQVEINPLAVTDSAEIPLMCVDAKIEFDDNAEFRQRKLFEMEDKTNQDPRELAATEAGLNFVGMDGNIGCLVNGAGLAMATMDIIKLYGGSPANFLDVGGGATVQQVTEAFKILQSDKNVRSVFVNIFGGIMRCDLLAEGLVKGAKTVGLTVPLIIRLCGNKVDEGRQILEESGISCYVIDDFDKAARKACSFAV